MTGVAGSLERAREAYRRRDWVTARRQFALLRDAAVPLRPDDICAEATCAWWLGDVDAAVPLQQAAYRAYLAEGLPEPAALVAIDTGYMLAVRGDAAQASGWVGRARRLLADLPPSVGHGYLDYLDFETALGTSDLAAAAAAADRVGELGDGLGDATLIALGALGQGRVLVRRGAVTRGMALLDEAMVAAVSDELDPAWAGNIYCHLMVACDELVDLRRAAEWTEVTARWCERMPGAGPFPGICRVHRARILHVRGDWDEAEREAMHVCRELADFDVEIVAEAHQLMGQIELQRGNLDGAEAAFREAHRLGRDPQPALALLRLAQGEVAVAAASIAAALAAVEGDPLARARLLPAAVEAALAAGDTDEARAMSDELATAARTYGTTGLAATSLHALGATHLSLGDAAAAVPALRGALRASQEVVAPYDVARTRTLLATAYDRLGDPDAAARERDAADVTLTDLGVRARGVDDDAPARHPAGLTPRETEVLALVATGRSNQQIAGELVLSVRTVERHLSTVYQKLGLEGRSARAGAVSHALREGILTGR